MCACASRNSRINSRNRAYTHVDKRVPTRDDFKSETMRADTLPRPGRARAKQKNRPILSPSDAGLANLSISGACVDSADLQEDIRRRKMSAHSRRGASIEALATAPRNPRLGFQWHMRAQQAEECQYPLTSVTVKSSLDTSFLKVHSTWLPVGLIQ